MAVTRERALGALAEAVHGASKLVRDEHDIDDAVLERVVRDLDGVLSKIGDEHGDPVMAAAILSCAAAVLEGMAEPGKPEEMS